jgi:hypothetical protein
MTSAARKIAACEALFDSPIPGEAAAARAAHARLIERHGKPKAKTAKIVMFEVEESWGVDETAAERDARLKRWDDYLGGKPGVKETGMCSPDTPIPEDIAIGRWLLDFGLWVEKLPGSALIEPRWIMLDGATAVLTDALWEDVAAFARSLGYQSENGDGQQTAPATHPNPPHPSSHTERGQIQETSRA